MTKRFELIWGDKALNYQDPDELFSEWEDKYYLIDNGIGEVGVIVFADGSYEAPEDNNLGRHFSGLVDLLNEVAAETVAS
jgi:hypothetical protein